MNFACTVWYNELLLEDESYLLMILRKHKHYHILPSLIEQLARDTHLYIYSLFSCTYCTKTKNTLLYKLYKGCFPVHIVYRGYSPVTYCTKDALLYIKSFSPVHIVQRILSSTYCTNDILLYILWKLYCTYKVYSPVHIVQMILSCTYCTNDNLLYILYKGYSTVHIQFILLYIFYKGYSPVHIQFILLYILYKGYSTVNI